MRPGHSRDYTTHNERDKSSVDKVSGNKPVGDLRCAIVVGVRVHLTDLVCYDEDLCTILSASGGAESSEQRDAPIWLRTPDLTR